VRKRLRLVLVVPMKSKEKIEAIIAITAFTQFEARQWNGWRK
jgi:hypothetical protein